MGYSVSTCHDDFSDGGQITYKVRFTYSEVPFPETLVESVLGPDFKTAKVYEDFLTINGVETSEYRYGLVSDPDEPSKWAEGDPDGDWLGSDYYRAEIVSVHTSHPDEYLEWIESGAYWDTYLERHEISWGQVRVDAAEFERIKAGAEIVGFCTTPPEEDDEEDDDDTLDLETATRDELDLITDAVVVADYIDTIVIDEPSLLDRGWSFVEETVDGLAETIKTRFSSPEYEWEDLPDHDALYGDGYWLNKDDMATEHTEGTGIADFYDKTSETVASGLTGLLKDALRKAGMDHLVDHFDSAGDAKEFHDITREELVDKVVPMLDNFEIVDGEMREIQTLDEMEEIDLSWRERFSDYLDEKFPAFGAIFKDLTASARHSDVSYEFTLDARDLSPGDGHSNRVSFGEGHDRYNGRGGEDVLLGGGGRDKLRGGGQDDWLSGGARNDVLRGNNGKDDLSGGNGQDRLFGGNGADDLSGGRGRDHLDGGRGRDLIEGGGGRDHIDGGRHSDILTGGRGKDVFIFNGQSGKDTITDFAAHLAREDIDLSAVKAIRGFRDLAANHMEQVGDDVVISGGRIELTLLGVDIDELDRSDFLF